MENHCFNQGHLKYLCILGYDDGEYDCYACETEDEVFKAISDRIFEEIKWITQDGTDFSHWEEYGDADTMDEVAEIKAYISMLKSQEVIKNPAILFDFELDEEDIAKIKTLDTRRPVLGRPEDGAIAEKMYAKNE